MSDKKKHGLREQLRRVVISSYDVDNAKIFAKLILSHKLHDHNDDETKYLHRGLNTAMIVSYARPFSNNDNKIPHTVGSLKKDLPNTLYDSAEQKLHKRLLMLRNKIHAHSDSDAINLQIEIVDFQGKPLAIPCGYNPYIPLSQNETKKLLVMLDKLLNCLFEEQSNLQKKLPIGEEF